MRRSRVRLLVAAPVLSELTFVFDWPWVENVLAPRTSSLVLAGFPSGQRDQTVNLTAMPSKVRILLPPPLGRCCCFGQRAIILAVRREYGGYGTMVEPQPSKLMMRVRFPLPAPQALDKKFFELPYQSLPRFLKEAMISNYNPLT